MEQHSLALALATSVEYIMFWNMSCILILIILYFYVHFTILVINLSYTIYSIDLSSIRTYLSRSCKSLSSFYFVIKRHTIVISCAKNATPHLIFLYHSGFFFLNYLTPFSYIFVLESLCFVAMIISDWNDMIPS